MPATMIKYSIQDGAGETGFGGEHKYEISESMRQEMEYDCDRAW